MKSEQPITVYLSEGERQVHGNGFLAAAVIFLGGGGLLFVAFCAELDRFLTTPAGHFTKWAVIALAGTLVAYVSGRVVQGAVLLIRDKLRR